MKNDETNRSKWFSMVEEQSRSGLTQIAFCKERNLVLSRFVYYRGLVRSATKVKTVSPEVFTPIQVKNLESSSSSEIRIVLPNGFQCFISSRIEVLQIKRLVEALLTC